jgi:hypothetical protein
VTPAHPAAIELEDDGLATVDRLRDELERGES